MTTSAPPVRPPLCVPQIITQTVSDGYEIRGRLWSRPGAKRAVLYLHGIQSHGGWYEWSGSTLAAAGMNVFMPDRRGSGLNSAARGDTPGMQRWLDDLDEHVAWMQRELGVDRIDILGVSWGGKLAMAWANAHADTVDRVLLIAPGIFPRVRISLLRKLQVGASLLTNAEQRYAIPLNDARLFTNNPAGRAFIDGDVAKLTEATARFFYYSTKLDALLARIAARSFRPRADLVLAGEDKIIRNDLTAAWIETISSSGQNHGIHEFPSASHTVEFETSIDAYERYLQGWAAAS